MELADLIVESREDLGGSIVSPYFHIKNMMAFFCHCRKWSQKLTLSYVVSNIIHKTECTQSYMCNYMH
jgi:hypothetical protein